MNNAYSQNICIELEAVIRASRTPTCLVVVLQFLSLSRSHWAFYSLPILVLLLFRINDNFITTRPTTPPKKTIFSLSKSSTWTWNNMLRSDHYSQHNTNTKTSHNNFFPTLIHVSTFFYTWSENNFFRKFNKNKCYFRLFSIFIFQFCCSRDSTAEWKSPFKKYYRCLDCWLSWHQHSEGWKIMSHRTL